VVCSGWRAEAAECKDPYVHNDIYIHVRVCICTYMRIFRERSSSLGAGAAGCKDPRLLYMYVDKEKYIHLHVQRDRWT
jgi:hypothetical protein